MSPLPLSLAVLASVAAAIGTGPAQAAASPPPLFAEFPAGGAPGSGAGQFDQARGVATSPVTHHVYLADTENRRISEFTAWGEFVQALGWGVRDGSPELQSCTTETGCLQGLTGAGPGQFGAVPEKSQYQGPTGIAIDPSGDVWVMDLGNFRVQKFDSDGNFLMAVGGEVNETTGENVCTAASGDTCVAGQPGTDPGEFSIENKLGVLGDFVDVGPDGTLYVGDKDRIQSFEPDGSFKAAIPLPEPGNPGSLAVDPVGGDIYFGFSQPNAGPPPTQPGVFRLDPGSGAQIGSTLPIEVPLGLAVAPNGRLYAVDDPVGASLVRVVELDLGGTLLSEFNASKSLEEFLKLPAIAAGAVGESSGDVDVYVVNFRSGLLSVVRAYGAIPDPAVVGPPPAVPPTISAQFASEANTTSATLKAEINPRFWNDTTFYLEYGTQDCEVGPCEKKPASGKLLTSKVASEAIASAGILLDGLEPKTTYHYRFVAQSGGGGPVQGPDATFTTRAPEPAPNTACPNQAYRTGPGAFLPDCRAYEMVSPTDKSNADIITLYNSGGIPARRQQADSDGGVLTYSAFKAFADPVASPYTSQYVATRGAGGWANRSISPPRSGPTLLELSGLDSQFKAFSADLCSGWFLQDTVKELVPEAVDDYPNLYRASLCEEPTAYEAITRVQPPARAANEYLFEVQGQGGGHTVFRANDKLTPNAPAGEAAKLYDYHEGAPSYVCVLPNGSAVSSGCSAGTGGGGIPSEQSGSVGNAVSADGERIFWSAAGGGAGRLYLREGGQTIAISKASAQFWGAAADGSRAIFSEGGSLYEFEVGVDAPEAGEPIAGEVAGVVGIGEDASRVYLVSREALDGAAQAGEPNLYLAEAGEFEFIATLSNLDVDASNKVPSDVAAQAFRRAARTSADGGSLAFISNNALTGQDSHEVGSGEPAAQVYLYEAGSGQLRCASCNATGARPIGRNVKDLLSLGSDFWASAFLPATESQLYFSRALSEDGRRLYFNSFDSLVARDTNEALDVYQWEAEGKGDCEDPGGCVSLISSGESPQDSEFVDASASGNDVFFSTQSSLIAQDSGLIDIYDARAGGGFPAPPPPEPECQGEACQAPFRAPKAPTPASAAFRGPGNPVAGRSTRACNRSARRAKRLSRRAKRLRRGARAATAPRAVRRKRARAARRSARAAKRVSASAKRCRARA